MKITEQHKIHYFVKEDYRGHFYSIELYCFFEISQRDDTSDFRQIEKVRLFYSKDMQANEVGWFEIDFGKGTCMGSLAKTAKELTETYTRDVDIYNYKVATQEEYLVLRAKAFEIYNKQTCIDFDTLKIGEEF
nr:hypothetical protein [uncultured Flavobacterium sp.]